MSSKRGGILFVEADNLLHAVDVDNQKMNDYTKERETCYNNSSLKGSMKMEIMKKFVRYYRPYRKVFLLDMLCALGISVIDLAFPQILNYLNATLFQEDARQIQSAILTLTAALLVMYLVRALCKYYVSAQGTHHGRADGTGYAKRTVRSV